MTDDRFQHISEAQPPFRIEIEPARFLSEHQELAILWAAHRHRPHSPLVRARLAGALLLDNDFDATIDLLTGVDDLTADESLIRIQAHLSRETPADNHSVLAIADRQLARVADAATRAQLLADKAKASRRLGQPDAARALLDAALACDPANKDACKRIAALDLEAGRVEQALATLEGLGDDGASHARFLAAQALAQARAGRIAVAREIVAFDTLHHAEAIDPPPGFATVAAFNTALAAELLAHPSLRFDRYGTASEQTWRIDTPLLGETPMLRLLLDRIARIIETHVGRIADRDHAWMRARPSVGMLHCWCVMTDRDGFETWHVHQFGWLSGVYYVQIPATVGPGSDAAGCIAFGLPEDLAGAEAAAQYGTTIVRPQAGMVMLFPSHAYHRTFPHGADARRICVAFDVWPGQAR
ncbi:putative 2OG-Fe(II) oxygenase [Sphingomonas sp. PAMC 26605]|uniref:putative 2OG-Fe(II) oxygenase n=1 Tax=Sphingomonas sp. PAMC 26605 TaxID=1112214 RepID=UPI00026CDD3C|nr:putative 2OG-Fe(II) oxygenase [Sphingomonas sp. PAMC 26605]